MGLRPTIFAAISRPIGGSIIRGGGEFLTIAEYESLTEYLPITYNITDTGDKYVEAVHTVIGPWTYEPSDIHVMKTGDDTTGDGSFGNPYLTISKGFDVAVAANGGTVWVHEGTYAESVLGGFFYKTDQAPTSRVYVKARPDQNVVWTHASGPYVIRFGGESSNITIQGFEVVAANSVNAFFYNSSSTSIVGVEFVECFFNDDQSTALFASVTGSAGSANFTVKRCTIQSDHRMSTLLQNIDGISFIGNVYQLPSTDAPSIPIRINAGCEGDIYLNNNTFNVAAGSGINQDTAFIGPATVYCRRNRITGTSSDSIKFTGGTDTDKSVIHIDYNVANSVGNGVRVIEYVSGGSAIGNSITSASDVALGFPTDSAATGTVENIDITDNDIWATGAGGHGLLVSQYGTGILIHNNNVYANTGGANYALVLKGISNTAIDNVFWGGDSNSIYVKSAESCVVTDNIAYQTVAGGRAIDFAAQDRLVTDCTITNNTVYVSDGSVYGFDSSDLSTGNVVDYNTYIVSGTGTWGSMFGNSVSSLADVQAQWAANYDVTTNDSNSTDV